MSSAIISSPQDKHVFHLIRMSSTNFRFEYKLGFILINKKSRSLAALLKTPTSQLQHLFRI